MKRQNLYVAFVLLKYRQFKFERLGAQELLHLNHYCELRKRFNEKYHIHAGVPAVLRVVPGSNSKCVPKKCGLTLQKAGV